MPDNPELKIYRVELVDESYKTHRVVNGGDPVQFPVRVWFSRPLDAFERIELAKHGFEVEVFDRDPMQAIVVATPDHFGTVIDNLNGGLPAVAEDARQARAAAEAEDEHLAALVQQININLRLRPEQ